MSTATEISPSQAHYEGFAPQPSASVQVKTQSRRLPWTKILAGSALAIALAGGIWAYVHHMAGVESTDDAFLDGDIHPVSPRINGTVLRVFVDDNAHVVAGQPLVEIDPADLNLAVQGAEADLAQARANATQVTAQIARAESEISAATARIAQNAAILNRAKLDFHRADVLASDNVRAIAAQELDAARSVLDSALATRESLIADRASAESALAAVQAQSSVARAQIQRSEAALEEAKLQAGYTIVRAPVSGRVAKKNVEVGQRLQPGQPVFAVVDDQVWVVANFKESQLTNLRAGEKVDIRIDAIDGHSFTGTVESFSPGTGAKFSLLPPDNSTGNFTKVVQRLPVKILFSKESIGTAADRLAPGLSAVVEISTRS